MPHRWCNYARIRQQQIESGLDITFNEVFKPIFVKKILSFNPESSLEVGAGTGHLSKVLSEYGLAVTAIEPSSGMCAVAVDVLLSSNVKLINCSSYDLEKVEIFNLVFSHLVAHVVDDLFDFFISIAKHIVTGGHYIFSIPHPCFYNDYKKFFGSEYSYMESLTKDVSFNITKDQENIIAGVPYNHRPLSKYFNTLVKAGFGVEEFDEIFPDKTIQEMYGVRWQSPRYCIFVCQKL